MESLSLCQKVIVYSLMHIRFVLLTPLLATLAWSQAPVADSAKLEKDLATAQKTLQDWPALGRYRAQNEKVASPTSGENRVVFMGDSITDNWARRRGSFFTENHYVGRGIGGQTTPQMLIRFQPDVIALKPKVVVILAGTNDIAGNTGPASLEDIENNLMSMTTLAKAHGIHVVLSSVMPVCDYIRPQTTKRPPEKIIALNAWMKEYADKNGFVYLDYYPAMLDDKQMLKKEWTDDGLHPNDAGYAAIEPLAVKAIAKALKK